MGKKPLVYFLCTGNSCRSQIADGFLQAIGGHKYEVKSAGLEAHGLNPRAVQTMKEVGIDISNHTSDVIDPDVLSEADFIITLCGHANDNCPVARNNKAQRWHWGFDDPAKTTGTEEEIIAQFRTVRDSIKERIAQFVQEGK
ncbi:arsenate reductase (thioredoxin) [Paenibacillus sp. KN14-4R]|uniref:arsenate reductase (thioredoxin) n=1 Tax=Paenibacillus sp. KN14-4R TaxID=3445773 RepID=UPI003FA03690